VLHLGWEAKAEEVVVWYYRAGYKKSEEANCVRTSDIDQEEIEHSSCKEAKEWINASRQ
jgi:hypothetical protein